MFACLLYTYLTFDCRCCCRSVLVGAVSGAPSLSKEEARLAGRAFRSLGTGSTPALVADTTNGGAAVKSTSSPAAGETITLQTATFASDVIAEINRIRANPSAYAAELKLLLSEFEGDKRFVHPKAVTPHVRTTMSEGKPAVEDLIKFLTDEIDAVPTLATNDALGKIAARLADNPKASPDVRLEAEGVAVRFGTLIEATSQGDLTPSEIVFFWLVGDGEPTRAIRKALLSSLYREVGVATVKKGIAKRLNVFSLANECHKAGVLPSREVFSKAGAAAPAAGQAKP